MTDGNLEKALRRIEATVYVTLFDTNMVFTVEDCRDETEMIPDGELRPIPTQWGHFGMFGFDPEDMENVDDTIRELLDEPV